jgi:hypothetical protein
MIAIYIHEVEVFIRKLYGHLVRKATMYLNLPILDLGLESLQNTKIAAIQFSLAALYFLPSSAFTRTVFLLRRIV